MLELLLLRHGKAIKNQSDTDDFSRHLNREGTAQVNQVGFILRSQNRDIGQIISSGATRALETAEIINHFMGVGKVEYDDALYLTDKTTILHKLCTTGKAKVLLYVGHNNGISDLASYLTGLNIEMSTSELITIMFDATDWKMITGHSGKLVNRLVPDIYSF
ncbi:MAG: histidine phosphatase family protein [Bacteroidetes bacterium]|nr:histidine phosphatase family protein [Bacteroidota bacterium]